MKPEIQIIDPIVKKIDAVKAVAGPNGTDQDLADLFGLPLKRVQRWRHLPDIWSFRIMTVYPTLPYTPKPLERKTRGLN